jgi:3-keto-L-gulonate-6-phosphate decarboxylase
LAICEVQSHPAFFGSWAEPTNPVVARCRRIAPLDAKAHIFIFDSISAAATAVTVLGSSPPEALDLFIARCAELGMNSMIDMLGVKDPLKSLRQLRRPPEVVVLHLGRDEEGTRGKMIQYRHVNRVRSKFDVLISAAGGVDLKQARSAIFNGANIVVANLVKPGDPWTGISIETDVARMAQQFLTTIE